MYCSQCGKEINPNSKFCKYCGIATSEENANIYTIEKRYDDCTTNYPSPQKPHVSFGEVAGIVTIVIGIIGAITSINQMPFVPSYYDEIQFLKIVLSIIMIIWGALLWAVGKNSPSISIHIFMLGLIILVLVAILGFYTINEDAQKNLDSLFNFISNL